MNEMEQLIYVVAWERHHWATKDCCGKRDEDLKLHAMDCDDRAEEAVRVFRLTHALYVTNVGDK